MKNIKNRISGLAPQKKAHTESTIMQKRAFLKTLAAAAAFSSIALLTGCGEQSAKEFKVGVTAGPHAAIVNKTAEVAAKDGFRIKVVEFTDYVTPNRALNDGQLDADVYQHEPFLNNYNAQQGTKLVKVAEAVVQPMGMYSNTVKSIEDVKDGAKFAIPNDPSNCARALILMQNAGLIRLRDGIKGQASPADVAENPKNLRIVELEAAQLPRSLSDVDSAVIPMNYVLSAGLKPKEQGFYFESRKAPFALIVIAARESNKDDPAVKKFIRYYRSPEVKEFIEKTFDGTVNATW